MGPVGQVQKTWRLSLAAAVGRVAAAEQWLEVAIAELQTAIEQVRRVLQGSTRGRAGGGRNNRSPIFPFQKGCVFLEIIISFLSQEMCMNCEIVLVLLF